MGDHNNNYLNPREKQDLETVTVPHVLIVSNTDEPTRIKGSLKLLIDYITTGHSTFFRFLFPIHLL